MWKRFLSHPTVYCRPFSQFSDEVTAYQVNFFTDASGGIGFGALCYSSWMTQKWDKNFIKQKKLDIEFLELFAVVVAVETWMHRFRNHKIIIYCDNQNVCRAINRSTTSKKESMKLVRILLFKCMTENVVLYAQYIKSKDNTMADMLSRDQVREFKWEAQKLHLQIDAFLTPIPTNLWPMSNLW